MSGPELLRYFLNCSPLRGPLTASVVLVVHQIASTTGAADEDKAADTSPAPRIPIFYLLCVLTFNNVFQADIFVNKSM